MSKGKGEARVMRAERTQVTMTMADLDGTLPQDHRARTFWAVLESLDLSSFYEHIAAREFRQGRPAIDPRILLGLWIYATSEGVGSAREVARLCEAHAAYRWICGGVSVNHHALSDFRVQRGAELDELMTQVIGVLLRQGVVTLKRTAQDGMRVRASAGASSFRREPSLASCLEQASARVEAMRKELEQPDRGTAASARANAAQKRAAEEREERVKRAIAELPKAREAKKKADEAKARVSTTDAEARVMKMGDGGFRPAYNVQLSTDVDSRVIVGVAVTNVGTDMQQMTPMLEQTKRRTGTCPEEHLVDGGFTKLEAIEAAAENGTCVYAPVPTPRVEGIDPHLPKPNDSEVVGEWRMRMRTEEAKAIYKQRASTAETVNADLRCHRGLDRLLVRGSDKVTCIALWAALTYNLLRWIELLPGA
jgi:transposase